MRLFATILLCLALGACADHPPGVRLTHPASAELPGLQGFQLMPPERAVDALPYRSRYPLINAELRQGLGGPRLPRERHPAVPRLLLAGAARRSAGIPPDLPPTSSMGPYLAIHRLRDETGTLRVRLVDLEERILWEGTASTGLSPARANPEQLERAVGALLQQLPRAR
ncbi:Uncharacterised protein [Pseudomonas aeruginosa]|nr:Uncharacterised protein [Pseudomonas aeruginosa]